MISTVCALVAASTAAASSSRGPLLLPWPQTTWHWYYFLRSCGISSRSQHILTPLPLEACRPSPGQSPGLSGCHHYSQPWRWYWPQPNPRPACTHMQGLDQQVTACTTLHLSLDASLEAFRPGAAGWRNVVAYLRNCHREKLAWKPPAV